MPKTEVEGIGKTLKANIRSYTKELDEAIEKANILIEKLKEIDQLINSLFER